jgi:hypothetical protein
MSIAWRDRVREHTSAETSAKLDDEMRDRLFHGSAMSDEEISARIAALDREWDIERYVEVAAPVLALTGIALSLRRRKWVVLPIAVLGFMLQHAVQGWCTPLVVLRRSGVRTRSEIDEERFALKALRGDFSGLPPDAPRNRITRVDAVLEAVRH